MKDLANVCLVLAMIVSFYTHYALGDNFERMAPSLIFGLLLTCRLIILAQVVKKEKADRAEMFERLLEEQEAAGQAGEYEEQAEEAGGEEEKKKI